MRAVEVGGSVGLVGEGQVIWAPADGVTARMQAADLEVDALLAVASSLHGVSEEAWRAAARAAGADPRSFAWRTIAEVHPIDDRWAVAVGEVEAAAAAASAIEVRAVDAEGDPVG